MEPKIHAHSPSLVAHKLLIIDNMKLCFVMYGVLQIDFHGIWLIVGQNYCSENEMPILMKYKFIPNV